MAEDMGMDSDRSLNMAHSGEGAQAAYDSASANISEARQIGSTREFNDEERRRLDDVRDSS